MALALNIGKCTLLGNYRENNEDAKVPGIVAIDALLLRIAHADPEPDQNARSDEDTIGG